MTRTRIYEAFGSLVGAVLAIIAMALAFSTYQTLAHLDPPYTAENFEASATVTDTGTVLTYHKDLIVHYPRNVLLYRAIVCDQSGFRYDFPLNMREFPVGVTPLHRQVVIPHKIPTGTRCVFTAYYEYRPTLAFYNRYVMLPDLSFEVK